MLFEMQTFGLAQCGYSVREFEFLIVESCGMATRQKSKESTPVALPVETVDVVRHG